MQYSKRASGNFIQWAQLLVFIAVFVPHILHQRSLIEKVLSYMTWMWSTNYEGSIWDLFTVDSKWKWFRCYVWCSFQFAEHHTYFSRDFKIMLAAWTDQETFVKWWGGGGWTWQRLLVIVVFHRGPYEPPSRSNWTHRVQLFLEGGPY